MFRKSRHVMSNLNTKHSKPSVFHYLLSPMQGNTATCCNPQMAHIIRKLIATNNAPKPVAPYNQAVLVDRTLYVSGVLGLNKDTMKLVEGGAVEEARQAFKNLGCILEEAGSSFEKVVKTTVLLNNIQDFASINEVYKEFFTHDFPARTAYQVGQLPLNANVEVEVIAVTGDVKTIPAPSKM